VRKSGSVGELCGSTTDYALYFSSSKLLRTCGTIVCHFTDMECE
jgi:hypothetical protein